MIRPFALVCCLLALGLTAFPAAAQLSPSAADIIEKLKGGAGASEAVPPPGRRTRGLSAPGAPAHAPQGPATAVAPAQPPAEKAAVDRLFTNSPRGLSVGERQAAAAIAKSRPAIDLTIYFDFNSADIGPQAEVVLAELGKALASPQLANGRFLVAGHTDAKGRNAYNQTLSERRAAAIKRYLINTFGIAEARLLPIGFGEEQLKNTADPFAPDNRRVQVVNLGN